MFTNKTFIYTAVCTLIGLGAASLEAQQAQYQKPITFGISAGAALPASSTRDDYRPGVDLVLDAQFRSWGSPIAFRIEGGYDRFGGERNAGVRRPTQQILSGRANVVYDLGGDAVKAYLIGGAGVYSRKLNGDDSWSGGKLGFNAGAGINLPLGGLPTFVEARWHYINTDGRKTNYIPLAIGLRF